MQRPLLITCEHGGNRIPPEYAALFASRPAARALRSHRGFDAGAAQVARALARILDAPLRIATVSRLLIDLNRSIGHRRIFSEFSRDLEPETHRHLIEQFYKPHRQRVEAEIARLIALEGCCIHVAVHSFTPIWSGVRRNADVGLLYDPSTTLERLVVIRWQSALRQHDPTLAIRRNYPYHGTTDGLTTTMRGRFEPDRYAGIELELNQTRVASAPGRAGLTATLGATLAAAITAAAESGYCGGVAR